MTNKYLVLVLLMTGTNAAGKQLRGIAEAEHKFLKTGLTVQITYASLGFTSVKFMHPQRIICEVLAGRAGK